MSDYSDQTNRTMLQRRNHMDHHPQNGWGSIQYDARFDEYWVHAGDAQQSLFYCPWCGEKLPPSQRDRWFDELESHGIDPLNDEVPELFRTGAWREQRSPAD